MIEMVTRITPISEKEISGEEALIDFARTIMACDARGTQYKVNVAIDGRVTLRVDGQAVSYLTGITGQLV